MIGQATGRMPALVGTGTKWTDEVVCASRETETMGADGVMIIPPFYSELYAHYKKVSDAISIPIMVYNNPATANVDMMPELIARLAQIPHCRHVKESALDPTRMRDIIRLAGGKMTVFSGVLGDDPSGWAPRMGRGVFQRDPALVGAVVRAGRRQARHGCRTCPLQEDGALLWWVGGPQCVSGTKACFELMGMPMGPPRAAPAAARRAATCLGAAC